MRGTGTAGGFIDRHFLLACAAMLSTSMVFYLLLTTMAVYAAERFGAGDAAAGFAATAFVLGSVATRLTAAPLMRRFGRRSVIIVASIAAAVLAAATPLAVEFWQLIVLRLLHGAAFGAVSTLVVSGVLERVPRERRAEAAGYLGVASTLSTAAGPLLAVTALGAGRHSALFATAFVMAMIGVAAALPLRLPSGVGGGGGPAPVATSSERAATDLHPRRSLAGFAVVVFLAGVAYASVVTYLSGYAEERGAPWSAGAYFAFYAALAFIGRLTLGRVQDRHGDNVVILPVLGCFAASLLLLGLAPNGWVIACAGIPMGLGFGMFLPSIQTAAARAVPSARMAGTMAVVYLAVDLGVGAAPVLLGPLIQAYGVAAMYLAMVAVVVVAAALYTAARGRHGGRPSWA